MEENIAGAKYSAMAFARYIIDVCTNAGNSISDLKLQKVLYYIQLAFIYHLRREAFVDTMEAWPYGPVVKSVYDAYSSYGSTKICLRYDDADIFTKEEKEIIYSVLNNCSNKSAWDLVEMSHVSNGPWDQIYKNGRGYKKPIPKNLIIKYALE